MRALSFVFGGALLAISAFSRAASGAEITAGPSTYRARLSSLAPGDTLRLEPGTYASGLPLSNVHGRAGAPITITGPEQGAPAIFTGRSCCNTVSLTDSSYLVIRHLVIDNGGLEVDGVKAEGDAISVHHVTLEHLVIKNFAANQQIVGISTKAPAWDWIVRFNRIERAGTGLYLGNSTGAAPFIRGLIEHNVVIDPIGYGMEIKHQNPRPAVAGIPTGDSVTIIRHNVFIKAANASTGPNARPNLLVGHWPRTGPGMNDRYEIYGNLLHQNASATEPLFQGEGNVAFHDNVLVNTFGPGVWIQPHNDVPKDVAIYHNTIYTRGAGVRVSGGDAAFVQRVVANAVFSPTPITGGAAADNVTAAFDSASMYVAAPSAVLGSMSFYPLAGRLSGPAVDLSWSRPHNDGDRDFNGTRRGATFRGAYEGEGTNPGWALQDGFKTLLDPGAPADAGVSARADATTPPLDAGAPSSLDGDPRDAAQAIGPDVEEARADASIIGAGDALTSTDVSSASAPQPAVEEVGCGCRSCSRRGCAGGSGLLVGVALLVIARARSRARSAART